MLQLCVRSQRKLILIRIFTRYIKFIKKLESISNIVLSTDKSLGFSTDDNARLQPIGAVSVELFLSRAAWAMHWPDRTKGQLCKVGGDCHTLLLQYTYSIYLSH
jgi:hypothetical protein